MWFGTRDGLNKYDGYHFKTYHTDDDPNSLVANDVRSLYFDKQDNRLWVGATGGLSVYMSKTDNFINYLNDPKNPNSISSNIIRHINRDRKGRLWIGTARGLNLLDETTNKFTRYYFDSSQGLANAKNDVKAIAEDRNGDVWFGTADGIYKMNTDENGSFFFEEVDFSPMGGLSDVHIKNILEDSLGNLWIGTFEGGLNYWNRIDNTITIYKNEKSNPNSLSHNNIRSLCFDNEENLWIATFVGLSYLQKGKNTFRRFTKSSDATSNLADRSIRSLYIDDRGSLWVGTYYGGINHLDESFNRFKNHNNTSIGNGLRGNVISSFAEDEENNLWIGTEGDGLNFYDKKTQKFQNFKYNPLSSNSLSGNNVKKLLLDGDSLWIGTFQGGLNIYDIKKNTFSNYRHDPKDENTISANNIYALLKEDNLMWVLTYGAGLDILNLENDTFSNYSNNPEDSTTLSSDLTRVILKTKNNQLWLGTEQGLNKAILGPANLPESFEVYLPEEKIYCLIEDSNERIWIGTFGNGFFRLDPKTSKVDHFTVNDGLPGNTVFGIIEVAEDELWLSTNNGLSNYNLTSKSFTNYDYSNGLENSEYNYNAYYKDTNGDLFFGGFNGFTYFNPEAIRPNEYIPSIVFTDIKINNKLVKVGDESGLLKHSINEADMLSFDYNEANFTIHFAALDYFSPRNNRYAYKLDGLDNAWTYSTGITSATYTIQNAGNYTFRLKGANSDGIWNNTEKSIDITVRPPAWRTWWAYLLYLLFFLFLVVSLVRFIRLRHNLQLEKISNHQQAELNEVKLRFFTNITHEFRTPLTLVLGPLNDLLSMNSLPENAHGKLKTVQRNAQRMLNLINQILTFRKLATDHTELKIVKGDIVSFLREVHLLFQESANMKRIKTHFTADAERIELWFDQEKLEKVFFNLLSNAYKFTPDGGKISISIKHENDTIKIRISDTGVGVDPQYEDQIFKRFYEKPNRKQSKVMGSGIGLAISKQMVELHQGSIYLDQTSNGPYAKGASFVIELPRKPVHYENVPQEASDRNYSPVEEYSLPVDGPQLLGDAVSTESFDSTNKGTITLLIVEDNVEVREYIRSIFIDTYKVLTAKNGVEGLTKAKNILPDLIISDVMMPEKDGIALCKEIKADFEISHIPVVLLTARTASLYKLQGLKTGADDYITKPFDPNELRLRVSNIIATRQNMRVKFKRVMAFDPEEVNITSADEVFIEKALQIVEKQIENYDFNINQFAYELAISRPLLFTKIKALTGQTPNNFIKNIKMKRAAQLLSGQKLNISEVAYKIGYKDVKYFRKCFKDHFEMTPTEFKQSDVIQ